MLTGADLVVTMKEDGNVSERTDVESVALDTEKELDDKQKMLCFHDVICRIIR